MHEPGKGEHPPQKGCRVHVLGALLLAACTLGLALLLALSGSFAVHGRSPLGTLSSLVQLPPGLLPPYLERQWPNKTLPYDALARGQTYQGTGRALAQFARRLIEGNLSTTVFLGGSVTTGRGASRDDLGYPARVEDWVRTHFPPASHVFLNAAMGGTTSGLAASCTDHFVPENASLVIIEFSVNDIRGLGLHHPQRAAFEMLLRKLRRRPRPPAVLLMHHWCWDVARKEGGKNPAAAGLYDEPDVEADLELIGQYYNIPSISLRAAAWPLMRQGIPPFLVDGFGPSKFFVDPCHPSDAGHQALADLIIYTIQAAAKRLWTEQQLRAAEAAALGAEQQWQQQLRRRMHGGPGRLEAHTWRRLTQQRHQDVAALHRQQKAEKVLQQQGADRAAEWLPPPFQEGVRDDAPPAVCHLGEDFGQLVVNASGFKYAPDFPGAPNRRDQKWGWSAKALGDWAELSIDTHDRREGGDPEGGDKSTPTTTVYFGYLRSFKDMGVATVTCVSGCTCKESLLDGHWGFWFSMVQGHEVRVSRHRDCRMRVAIVGRPQESMNATGEGAAGRIVLRSLVVSSVPLVMGD